MQISLIVAASQNGVIGKGNKLPWKLPADLKRFKELTMGHPVILGRKTFESIGKPLPGRTNIVVTKQKNYPAEGIRVAHSVEEAIRSCGDAEEIFVIGGASLYGQALPYADKIYLTIIHQDFEGDTRLFDLDEKIWRETFREPGSESSLPHTFLIYEKK